MTAWDLLPKDLAIAIVLCLPRPTARLVCRQARDNIDRSRTTLAVTGLGLDGRPATVAARFPNLKDLSIVISFADTEAAFRGQRCGCTWEEYALNIYLGLRAWADAVAGLRYIDNIHLDAAPAISCLSPEQDRQLAELFFPRTPGDRTVSTRSRGGPNYAVARCKISETERLPAKEYWRLVDANPVSRPLLSFFVSH